jgi:hypothetical protein
MRSVFALSIAASASLAAAQSGSDYPYRIDPDSVSSSDRDYWCQQNEAQCPLICLQQPGVTSMTTEENSCDSDQLTYTCICENGIVPNITQYSQTLPFFMCQAWGQQCSNNCNGDNTCQAACTQDHPCGAQSPFLGNSSLLSTMSSTQAPTGSATNKIPVTGFGGATQTAAAGGNQGGAASGTFVPGAATSMAVLFGSVFLGFALLL